MDFEKVLLKEVFSFYCIPKSYVHLLVVKKVDPNNSVGRENFLKFNKSVVPNRRV